MWVSLIVPFFLYPHADFISIKDFDISVAINNFVSLSKSFCKLYANNVETIEAS